MSPFVEIAAPGSTKARALAELCGEWGLGPEGVIAFGDMPNDLPLLAWAGHRVAVANAHPDILALADEVARTNNDDGVAHVLAAHFGAALASETPFPPASPTSRGGPAPSFPAAGHR